ncbi:MAG: LysR family transcriptional regulator [Planctomycetota bacterium]|nr:LysR family transcriptional regulator [Planctomycetota bacterium]
MTDLTLLRSFLATVDAGAITPAARALFLTQPALSRRLQQLEQEFGAPLLERSARGVSPTEEGRLVAEAGRDLVARWDTLCSDVRALGNLESGRIRIGGGATAVSFLLPAAIASFQERYPGVLFQVKEAGSREVERDVADERLELGLVTLPIEPDLVAKLEVTPLICDQIVLVSAEGHPFHGKKRIAASKLDGQDLVGFESPSAIRSLIDGALAEAGVRMNVVMELRSIPAILRMVITTRRLAFVSRLALTTLGGSSGAPEMKQVSPISVSGLSIARDLAVVRRRDRPLSPAAQAFLKLL